MSIKSIIKKASEGSLEEKDVIAYAKEKRITLDEFAHEFSKNVAQNYWDDVYSYVFADGAMNWLYGFLTNDTYLESTNNSISEFAMDIYLAFDAGEYHHSGDDNSVDPIRKYTNPEIEALLKKA